MNTEFVVVRYVNTSVSVARQVNSEIVVTKHVNADVVKHVNTGLSAERQNRRSRDDRNLHPKIH